MHSWLQLIWLLAQVLVGNLDGAVFRYLLLMGDFIDCVNWHEAKDFGAFAEVVYPFLNVSSFRHLFSFLPAVRNG